MKRTNKTIDKIIQLFEQNHGYSGMKEMKENGVHPRDIVSAIESGIIEKIKPGLYKLINYPWNEYSNFTDIFKANHNAVICLESASEYYGFTTFNPNEISIAIPRGSYRMQFDFPPVKTYFFGESFYSEGITTVTTIGGTFKIYSKEKTIIDLFRYREKIEEDIFFESLKKYLSTEKANINKILVYSEKFNLREKLLQVIKPMVV